MILGRAWALGLLVLPAVLLWLRLRSARPRRAEASSLLVWRKVSSGDTIARRPRPPLSAWLEAAGAVLLVLALADPAVPVASPGAVRVLLDASPSMHARSGDGRERIEAARAALGTVHVVIQEAERPEEALPALLAAGGPVVVVTDRRLPGFEDDPPRLRIVGVGERGLNAGVTAASGESAGEGRWRVFLLVEAFGSGGPVAGTLRIGDRERAITVAPGRAVEVVEEMEMGTEPTSVLLTLPGDGLSRDDVLSLEVRGSRPVVLHCRPEWKGHPLARALAAAGAAADGVIDADGPEGVGMVLEADPSPAGGGTLLFLPDAADGPLVEGASAVASPHPLTEGVSVDPSVTLGRRAAGAPLGETLLSDSGGPLVTLVLSEVHGRAQAQVHFGFLPGGTWVERDPSFVVFAQNLVEWTRNGPPRVEGRRGIDPAESREAAEGETFGDLDAALREAALPDPADRRSLAVTLLLAAGALLAAAWFAGR